MRPNISAAEAAPELLDGIAPEEPEVVVAEDLEELPPPPLLLLVPLLRLFLRQPPPTGTFRRAPPLVQYLRQVLQKCLG